MSFFSAGGENEKFEVILSARDQGLTQGLRKASTQLDETAERVKRLGEAYLAFEGIRKAIDLVKQFNAAAVGAQVQLEQQKNVVTNMGESWRGVGPHIQATLKSMGQAKGFLSGEMTDAFIKLETATGSSTKALKLLGTAQDLARGHNQSLTTTALLVAKAAEGNSAALNRYGITLPKVTALEDAFKKKLEEGAAAHVKYTARQRELIDQQKAFDKANDKTATGIAAIAKLQTLSGGAATAFANTAAGKYAKLQAQIEDLETSFGKAILPLEEKLTSRLSSYVETLAGSKRVQDDFKTGVEELGHGFGDLVSVAETVGPPLLRIADDVNSVVQAVGGIGPIIAFGAAWYSTGKILGNVATQIEMFSKLAQRGAALQNAGIGANLLAGPTQFGKDNQIIHATAPTIAEDAGAVGVDFAGLKGLSTDAKAAETDVKAAGTAVSDLGAVAGGAKPGIAAIGTALIDSFNPVTAIIGTVALLAGGIYLLSQQEANATKAAHGLTDALSKAGDASDKFNSAAKDLTSDKRSEAGARITLAGGKLNVKTAQAQLAAAPAGLDKEIARNNLAQAKQQVKQDAADLYSYELAVSRDYARKRAADQAHLAATSVAGAKAYNVFADTYKAAIQHPGSVGNRPQQYAQPGPGQNLTPTELANQNALAATKAKADAAAASLKAYDSAMGNVINQNAKAHPAIAATASALEGAQKILKRQPTKVETQYVLEHSKADDDAKSVAKEIKAFDQKKVKTTVEIEKTAAFASIASIHNNLLANLPKTWNVTVNFTQGSTVKPPRVPNRPGAATGAWVGGGSWTGIDTIPVMVASSEAILNPTQIAMVDAGHTVAGALAATGAPTIGGGGYATGGKPKRSALFSHEGPDLYAAAYKHNRPYAKAGPYQTKLGGAQETQFRAWLKQYNVPFDPDASITDYDMRGYWKANRHATHTDGQHFPDTWKTPYDTTFSDESRYATSDNPFVWRGENLVDARSGKLIFGHSAGGTPNAGGVDAVTQAIATANTKANAKKKKGTKHAKGTKAKTPEEVFQEESTGWQNSISGLLARYAGDQLHTTHIPPLVKDVKALLSVYGHRVTQLGNLRKQSPYATSGAALAAINAEKASDYGSIGTYTSDLQSITHPGAAPDAAKFTKSYSALQLTYDTDSRKAATVVPRLPLHPTKAQKAAYNAAVKTNSAGVRALPIDRQKMISALLRRVGALRAMRTQAKYKPYVGAILAEIDSDESTLQGLYNDKQQQADNAAAIAQQNEDAATQAALGADSFNDDLFQNQVAGFQEKIAADEAALPAGANVSPALTADTQSLYDFVKARTGTLEGIQASGLGGAGYKTGLTNELTSDYGILSGITQGNTGAGGSTQAVSADQQAQIDQLTGQLVVAQRASGLSDAAVRAFGSSGDIGTGGFGNAYAAGAAGPSVVQNIYTLHPGDPDTLAAVGSAATAGMALQQSIPNSRTTVNI